MAYRRILEKGPLENGGCCPQGGTIPWKLLLRQLRDAQRSRSQSGALPVAHHFEKVLREASSSWALLVALSYQNWELGKLPSAGARQRRKLHPVGAQCRRPCTLQDSGNRKRKFLPFSLSFQPPLLALHHTKCCRWNISTAHLHHHRAGKEGFRPEKKKKKKIDDWHKILYHTCVLQILLPGCGLPSYFLNSVFWKASVFNLVVFNVSIFLLPFMQFFILKKCLPNPKSKIFSYVFF